jgi:hypothetical protein
MPLPQSATPEWFDDVDVQASGARSVARQEQLKRIVKQHPQRDIPKVESVDPNEAPSRES